MQLDAIIQINFLYSFELLNSSVAMMTPSRKLMMFAPLITVGFLWGITNPFLKRGTAGVEKIDEKNVLKKVVKEISFLITNPKYTVPFLVNQCGSLIFINSLQTADLSLAIPIANSMAFVFTLVGGWMVGEEMPDKRTVAGMLLVSSGIICYMVDSGMRESSLK